VDTIRHSCVFSNDIRIVFESKKAGTLRDTLNVMRANDERSERRKRKRKTEIERHERERHERVRQKRGYV